MYTLNAADFQGIILAGVHRWGESDFERLLPRPLLPVADSPLICYALRWLREAGIRAATICANSESRLVRRCLGDGAALGFDLRYYEDRTPRGPAGSIRDSGLAWPAEHFVVIEASTIPLGDLRDVLAAHTRSGAALTVVVGADGDTDARPPAEVRPVGVYVFSRRALSAVAPTGYQDLKEILIPQLYARGESVLTYALHAVCPRITGVETYLAANDWMIGYLTSDGVALSGYERSGEVCIHRSARIADDVHLIGPSIIGPRSRLAPGVNIVGPSVLGYGCRIEAEAVLSRSVLWDGCSVGAGATVDRSILSFGARVAARARSDHRLHVGDAECCAAGGVSVLPAVPAHLRPASCVAAGGRAAWTAHTAHPDGGSSELPGQLGQPEAGLHA